MSFVIMGRIRNPQTIAQGRKVRVRDRLNREHGPGRWRKRKGFANVRLSTGRIRPAEVHWYEAPGIGRREMKIKRFLNE